MNKTEELLAELTEEVNALYKQFRVSPVDPAGNRTDRVQVIKSRMRKMLKGNPLYGGNLQDPRNEESRKQFILQAILESVSEAARPVETPVGQIVAYPKHKLTDSEEDYPGVYVDLLPKGNGEPVMLAVVEWLPNEQNLSCCVYADGNSAEPVPDPIRYTNLEESEDNAELMFLVSDIKWAAADDSTDLPKTLAVVCAEPEDIAEVLTLEYWCKPNSYRYEEMDVDDEVQCFCAECDNGDSASAKLVFFLANHTPTAQEAEEYLRKEFEEPDLHVSLITESEHQAMIDENHVPLCYTILGM